MYEELAIAAGSDLTRWAWRGIVAVDLIQKGLLQTRPYEVVPGEAEAVYAECLKDVTQAIRTKGDLVAVMKKCRALQASVRVANPGSRPVIGVVGEIYVRSNDFSNENALRAIEQFGGEAWLPPFHEWLLYTNETSFARSKLLGRWRELAGFKITHHFQVKDLHDLEKAYKGFLRNEHEPEIKETYEYAAPYLDPTFEGEAILSVGKCKDFINKGASGLVNIMPFTCMPGMIVTALLKRFREDNDGIPFLNMSFDGQEQTNTITRLEAFMYQVNQYWKERQ
jgi:predicted nucleotide-binding protein (sugar kinase/HSP70/actin superfamily)